ncbi:MAG: 23S rRNA (adenine(2503)-C(2))-methyltransferase RlmN [Deltaproteobacteria bacterium]|nr:23S rRNA (adenine(2503)-C(2))-methyltransferase RlmN [Deltaproteobacteria bacterium]
MRLTIVADDGSVSPAPERLASPSAWSLRPDDLAERARSAGVGGSAAHLFRQLQRVSTWRSGQPDVGREARRLLDGLDRSLPAIVDEAPSADGSVRMVLRTVDGHHIEAVHMPRPHVGTPRTTFCISSQVGCAMGCTFCATGTMGIVRNLSAGEIVGQVLALMAAKGPATGHQLNLVFMGMGEPLHNLDNVARAVEVLCDERGVGLSPRRITVSTSGLVPALARFAALPVRPLLSVSINATTDETRSRVMPVNRSFNLAALKAALRAFPFRRGEKVLLAYVLLRGENDAVEDVLRLAEFAAGLHANVNLIPLNEHERSTHRAPDDDWVATFSRHLYDALAARDFRGVLTVRNNRGRDARGACGQLVQGEPRRRRTGTTPGDDSDAGRVVDGAPGPPHRSR